MTGPDRPGSDTQTVTPIYFPTAAAFRAWLLANHETADELIVGFCRVATGRPSLTWSEAVDEALCVGWIDGIRRSVDAERYTNRFTPRRAGSNWSAINIAKVEALEAQGRMLPAGRRAFEARDTEKSAIYSYERPLAALDPDAAAAFRASAAAWTWFEAQAPSYRRVAIYWVVSAKRPETRERRLATLIADSAAGRRIGPLIARRPDRPKETS
jgi:uncharacterized protein YdeI (YjbR/CyaY-like superfamily)